MRNELNLIFAGVVAFALGPVGPVFGQTYPVTGITISLPANPDANTANWSAGPSALTITATASGIPRTDPSVANSRVLVGIRQGGKKICGSYTGATAPSANFTAATKVWSGRDATALLGTKDCTLPAGDYELTVQALSVKESTTELLPKCWTALTVA